MGTGVCGDKRLLWLLFVAKRNTNGTGLWHWASAADFASNGVNDEHLHVRPGAELYLFFRQA